MLVVYTTRVMRISMQPLFSQAVLCISRLGKGRTSDFFSPSASISCLRRRCQEDALFAARMDKTRTDFGPLIRATCARSVKERRVQAKGGGRGNFSVLPPTVPITETNRKESHVVRTCCKIMRQFSLEKEQ